MTLRQETVLLKDSIIDSHSEVPSRVNVYQMFDRISRRYDLLNHILSFGLDIYWRRKAVAHLGNGKNQIILDLACGTCDLALAAIKNNSLSRKIIAVDMSANMLSLAATKIEKNAQEKSISLIRGDGMAIPFGNGSCDAAMIAFGIRNMPDTAKCLAEICRLLKPGGKILVLEFSLPKNRLIRSLHLFYLRNILPVIGSIVSGDSYAYSYLNRTVETYYQGEEFCQILSESGFVEATAAPLTFGIVTVYAGSKL